MKLEAQADEFALGMRVHVCEHWKENPRYGTILQVYYSIQSILWYCRANYKLLIFRSNVGSLSIFCCADLILWRGKIERTAEVGDVNTSTTPALHV